MKNSAFASLGFALLFGIGSPVAASAGWQNIGPSPPAVEGPVAVDPASGTIYIGTFGGGVLKSTDNGLTFAGANTGLAGLALAITSIAMDPTNSNIVIIGTGGSGIFRTVDGAASWMPTSEVGTLPVFVTVDPMNPMIWYAGFGVGSSASIKKSVNGGVDWTRADIGVPTTTIWSIAVDSQNPGVVYAGSGNAGAFKSTNGGTSWTALPIQPVIWSVAIDPNDSEVVYAGGNGDGVFKSTDAGTTFSRIGSPDAGVVLALAVDPTDSSMVYAGTVSGGLALSKDGGASWKKTSFRNGIALSLSVTADGDLYAGTGFHGVLTNSGGRNRKRFREIAAAELRAISAQNVFSVTIDPRDSNHLFLGTNDGGLLGSSDGGALWRDVGNGLLTRAPRKATYHPTNPGHLYVGSFDGGGLYSSTDNGETWTRRMFGSPAVYVWTVAADPSSGAVYAGTRGEGLWRSSDGTDAFVRLDGALMPQVRAIVFDSGKTFVGSNSGLWRSVDGGTTFIKVAAPFTLTVSVDPMNSSVIYATTQTLGVYKSIDGGATFSPSNTGLTNLRMSRAAPVAIDPSNSSTLYVSTEGGGVFKSVDGGSSWRAVNSGLTQLTVFGLALDANQPNVLYATGPSGVFKTISGGE